MSDNSLRVGRIPFLVCAPYFHASLAGLPETSFVDAPPRVLNSLLDADSLDCAPSSSFEYARHPDHYVLLPGLCTSGRAEVKSVLFLSDFPWEKMTGKAVLLSPESDSSNALFRVLCRFRFGVEPDLIESHPNSGTLSGRVLIGDASLRETRPWPYRYDLAAAWQSWQRTPLPFGLWMVRSEAWERKREAVLRFHQHLRYSLARFFDAPENALREWSQRFPLPLPMPEALDFFTTADYALSPAHENALRTFFDLCRQAGLIRDNPDLRFAWEGAAPQAFRDGA